VAEDDVADRRKKVATCRYCIAVTASHYSAGKTGSMSPTVFETHERTFVVSASDDGRYLDRIIRRDYKEVHLRGYLKYLLREGHVSVNGEPVKGKWWQFKVVHVGDDVKISFVDIEPQRDWLRAVQPQAAPLEILYEDEHLIAVNKPPYIPVNPASHYNRSVLAAVIYHVKDGNKSSDEDELEEDVGEPAIVHRLDKDTSGVLLAGKTPEMRAELSRVFKERKVLKTYIAISSGRLIGGEDGRHEILIDAPLKCTGRTTRVCTLEEGALPSVSRVRSLFYDQSLDISLLEVVIETGRRHQIRSHLAYIGCPVLGDKKYGDRVPNVRHHEIARRQLLHARTLKFLHPFTDERLVIEAPLWKDMAEILSNLKINLSALSSSSITTIQP